MKGGTGDMSTEDKITDALATDLKNRYIVLEELVKNMHQINQQLEETLKRLDNSFPDDDIHEEE